MNNDLHVLKLLKNVQSEPKLNSYRYFNHLGCILFALRNFSISSFKFIFYFILFFILFYFILYEPIKFFNIINFIYFYYLEFLIFYSSDS